MTYPYEIKFSDRRISKVNAEDVSSAIEIAKRRKRNGATPIASRNAHPFLMQIFKGHWFEIPVEK